MRHISLFGKRDTASMNILKMIVTCHPEARKVLLDSGECLIGWSRCRVRIILVLLGASSVKSTDILQNFAYKRTISVATVAKEDTSMKTVRRNRHPRDVLRVYVLIIRLIIPQVIGTVLPKFGLLSGKSGLLIMAGRSSLLLLHQVPLSF